MLIAGIAAASAAFTVLCTNAGALTSVPTDALAAAVLLVGSVFVVSASMAALDGRLRDLAILRALGWRRLHIGWRLGGDFALISLTAGLLAVLVTYCLQAAIGGTAPAGWPLLSVPAAVAMTVCAAWWQVRRATAAPPRVQHTTAVSPAARSWRYPMGILHHMLRSVRRAPAGAAVSALVIGVACAAVGAELAVQWDFGGVLSGSWFGAPVSWQFDTIDVAAVVTVVMQAIVTTADLNLLTSVGRHVELRTLRAIGWPARGVLGLAAGEAMLPGLAGGVVASLLDVAVIGIVVRRTPAGLIAVVAVVIVTGVVMSLIAAGVAAAAAGRALRAAA